MQTLFTLRIPKAIFVGLLLLIAIPSTLYPWDRDSGVAYSERWWDRKNDDDYNYYNEGTHDCANFVSQCLIAMGVSLSAGPGTDNRGCIPNCGNLNTNLDNSQGITPTTITWSNTNFPSNLRKGDVIIFGDTTGNYYKHAVFVVSGTGSNALSNAHCTDRHQKGITWWYGTGANQWKRATFYHKP